MRKLVSPLGGIQSPFGPQSGTSLSSFAVNGVEPQIVFDAATGTYKKNAANTNFSGLFTTNTTTSSLKTMVNSAGKLVWAPHNLLPRSEDIGVNWVVSGALDGTKTFGVADPEGGTKAARITPNTGTGDCYLSRNIAVTPVAVGAQYTNTWIIRAGDFRYFRVIWDGISFKGVSFDTQTLTVSDPSSGLTVDNGSISDLGGGWFSLTLTAVASGAGGDWRIYVLDAIGSINVTGDSAKSFDVAFPRVYRSDLGGMADNPDRGDSYVPTTSSAVYMGRAPSAVTGEGGHYRYDPVTAAWVNKGILLEGDARTNLLEQSNDFSTGWTNTKSTEAQNATGPDGVANSAWTVTDDGGGGTANDARLVRNITVATSTTYAFSIYIKAGGVSWARLYSTGLTTPADFAGVNFDLATGAVGTEGTGFTGYIEDAGNGWFRCSVVFTTDAVDTSGVFYVSLASSDISTVVDRDGTSSILVYGAQFEAVTAGTPYPLSYIPTNGATYTRAAETLQVDAANMPDYQTPNVIGPELVTNGDLAGGDTGYIEAGGAWVFQNGRAEIASASGFDSFGQGIIGIDAGKAYLFEFDYNVTSGSISASLSGPGSGFSRLGQFTGSGRASLVCSRLGSQSDGFHIRQDNGATGWVDNISVREIDPLAVSIYMRGEVSYGDSDSAIGNYGGNPQLYLWLVDANNYVNAGVDTFSTRTGRVEFSQGAAGVHDEGRFDAALSPAQNAPFSIAARHGSTFINGAVDGTALTADTTPTALADLSATNFYVGAINFNGTIEAIRVFAGDVGDTGLEDLTS